MIESSTVEISGCDSPGPLSERLLIQLTEAFPWDMAPRYLLRDRDASYGAEFRKRVAAMDITEVITAPRSPWQHAYVSSENKAGRYSS